MRRRDHSAAHDPRSNHGGTDDARADDGRSNDTSRRDDPAGWNNSARWNYAS